MNTIPQARRWQVLALLAAAFFMTILDSTIVLTAIPSIAHDRSMHGAGLQWIVTGYVIAYGGLLLFCGRAADLLGRKRMFIAGNALWVLSSLLCGLAPTGEILVTGRVVQGFAAAVIAPAALSIVMITFPEGPGRNKALGVWGGLGGVGATAGLLLGGVITDGLGWPWIFFVNVPVGAVVLGLAPGMLREGRSPARARSFDVAGAVTITGALVLIVYAITAVPGAGWASAHTAGSLLGAAALGAVFIAVEYRSTDPLVPFRLLRSKILVGGNLLIFTAGMAVDGMLITLTSHVQRVLGWSATQFGLLAAAMTVTSVIGVVYGQHALGRFGVRPVGLFGSLLLGIAGLVLTFSHALHATPALMVAALFVFGAGMGAAFVSSQIAALTGVEEENSGLAAGLVDTSFHIGTGLGVAIVTSVALTRIEAAGGPVTAALTEAHQAAFGATVAFATAGAVVALILLRRPALVGNSAEATGSARDQRGEMAQGMR